MTGYARTAGDGIDERLSLHVVEVDGRLDGSTGDRQEILYVLSGSGTLHLDGGEHELDPDAGVLLLPGEAYALEGSLRVVSVVAPAEREIVRERVVSRFADREEERADARRTFRVLHEGELTQFVGIVEPCRAPDHSHPYDEVGYIVEGEGVAHIARRAGAAPRRVVLLPAARLRPLHREHRPGRDADHGRVPSGREPQAAKLRRCAAAPGEARRRARSGRCRDAGAAAPGEARRRARSGRCLRRCR